MDSAKNDTNLHGNIDDQTKNEAMKQFYFIVTCVFIILIVFLCFFIYNLIKCYLPKWMNKRELIKEMEPTTQGDSRRIEFDEL